MNINAKNSLQGKVAARQTLGGKVAARQTLGGKVAGTLELIGDVNVGGMMPDHYEGEYEVTPKVNSQTLETKEKYLVEDVKIKEIPYFDTSNISGGTTVYIGSDIEFE